MKVYSSTFILDEVRLREVNDVASEWVRQHGRPGDTISAHEDIQHYGTTFLIVHEFSWETPCGPSPDGRHCNHWYDADGPCCFCDVDG